VANGETVTGVTILYVSEQMDAGDLILQREWPIHSEDTAATLEPLLAEAGAELLQQAVEQIRSGTVRRVPQDSAAVTEVRKLVKEDGELDWTQSADLLRNRIRGLIVWPGCCCTLPDGQRLKVLRAVVEERAGEPGEILEASGAGLLVAAGRGALRLLSVQPAGRGIMECADYLRGHPLVLGTRLALLPPPG
jgi:methionyl-tRNA formyltransferase